MARLYLTNIDLNNNELQNAVIQNLSSAPQSGNKEGRIYYDNTTHKLRVFRADASQGTKWYDLSVGGTAASQVILTGDVTGNATVDPATGIITLATHFNVSGTTNQIAVNDIDNTTTISLTDTVDINTGLNIGGSTTEADGYIHLNDANGDRYGSLELNGSDLRVYSNSGIIQTNENEIQVQKTSYWRNGTQQGVIAAQSDGSLRLTGINNGLQLESNSGDIKINSASGTTYFNNAITINSEGTINATNGNLTLTADSGVIDATGVEIHTTKVELWNGSNHGAILAHPSDGSLTVAATGWLHLESHDGGISIDPDNGQTTFSNQVRIDSNGTIETNNSDLTLSPDSGNVVINNNLVTNAIVSKDGSNDELNINASVVQINSSNVTVGGGGTDGGLTVKNSNGDVAFTVDGSTKDARFGNNVTIDGNLNVTGTLNAVNRTEINIEDNTIKLNTNWTGAPTQDAGIIVNRGTANDTAIIWSESNKDWTLTNDGSNYYAIARKFVATVGDASNTLFDVVHNLGTRDLTVQVRENNAEYNLVETDVLFKDNNTVTIGFTDAPDANAYKIIIVG